MYNAIGTGGTKDGAVERCTNCRGSGIQVRLQQVQFYSVV